MKRIVLLQKKSSLGNLKYSSSIAFILLLNCFLACSSGVKKPVLTLEKDTIQVGTIKRGDSILVSIKVFNSGDDTLKLTDLAMSCGCTKGVFTSNTVIPGQIVSISLEYKNAGDIGSFDKSVVIENNSDNPFKILRIQGTGVE